MTTSALRAHSSTEVQLMEIQARFVGVANLARREGDERTARAALALCDLTVGLTTEHAMRGAA